MMSKILITSSLTIAQAAAVESTSMRSETADQILSSASAVASGMYLEIAFLVFFLLGFGMLRLDKMMKARQSRGAKILPKLKILRSHYTAGDLQQVRKVWRQIESNKSEVCAPLDVMRMAMHSIIEVELRPTIAIGNMMKYITGFIDPAKSMLPSEQAERCARPKTTSAGNTMIMNAMLQEILSRAERTKFADFAHAVQTGLEAHINEATLEVLLAGYAGAGDERRVDEAMCNMRSSFHIISPRAFAVTVEGFLRCGKMDRVKSTLTQMQEVGCTLSSALVIDILKSADSLMTELFDVICTTYPKSLSADALAVVLDDSFKRGDASMAEKVEALREESGFEKTQKYSEALLKCYAKSTNMSAFTLFDALHGESTITENAIVSILCACAQGRFTHFAKHVFNVRKGEGELTLPIFSAMMKVYAMAKRFNEACDLYPLIQSSGVTMDGRMIGCLVTFASRCQRTDLLEQLGEFTGNTAPHYSARIRACRVNKDAKLASEILTEMRAMGCVDAAACNSAIDVYVAAGKTDEAKTLLEEFQAESIFEDDEGELVGYNTVIKGYCIANRMDNARALIDEMRAKNLAPNTVSFNCMLNASVCNRDYSEAWALYLEMQGLGVKEDSITASTLVKGLKNCNDENFCRNVLELTDKVDVDVNQDEVFFIVLLDVFTKRRDTRRLKRILQMVNGQNLSPSIVTVNTMLKAFSQLKMVDEAKALWQEMIESRQMTPTEITLGCMVDALGTNGKVDEAAQLVKAWKNRVRMNTIIYSTLIKGYAIARDAPGAHEVFELMKEEGCIPNLVTVNTLIDASARGGRMDLCAGLLESMQGMDIKPDRITFSTIVKGFCLRGDLEQAMAVLEPMKRQGFHPDLTIYNTLIDGCAGNDRYSLCDQIFNQMQADDVAPSVYTLTVLIKRYGREGKVDAAFDFFDSVSKKYNLKPAAQSLTCLISVCIINKQLPRAIQVLERMRSEGPAPDAVTYGKVISGCLRANVPEKACGYVLDAYGINKGTCAAGNRTGLEQELLHNLVDQLVAKKLVDSHAIPLVQKLRAANVQIPQRLVSATLCGAMNEKPAPWNKRKH